MSEYVMVPRAVAEQYWHRPWPEVFAAAEAGTDGLALRSPRWTPWRDHAPTEEQYRDARTGFVARDRFEKDTADWQAEQDVCFLRCAEGWTWPDDTTLLFQQNW